MYRELKDIIKLSGIKLDEEWENTPEATNHPDQEDMGDLRDWGTNVELSLRRYLNHDLASPEFPKPITEEEMTASYKAFINEVHEEIAKKAKEEEAEEVEEAKEEDDDVEEVTEELTAAQKKLPQGLRDAIAKKQGNSDDTVEEETEEEKVEETIDPYVGLYKMLSLAGVNPPVYTPVAEAEETTEEATDEESKKKIIEARIWLPNRKAVDSSTGLYRILALSGYKKSIINEKKTYHRFDRETDTWIETDAAGNDLEVQTPQYDKKPEVTPNDGITRERYDRETDTWIPIDQFGNDIPGTVKPKNEEEDDYEKYNIPRGPQRYDPNTGTWIPFKEHENPNDPRTWDPLPDGKQPQSDPDGQGSIEINPNTGDVNVGIPWAGGAGIGNVFPGDSHYVAPELRDTTPAQPTDLTKTDPRLIGHRPQAAGQGFGAWGSDTPSTVMGDLQSPIKATGVHSLPHDDPFTWPVKPGDPSKGRRPTGLSKTDPSHKPTIKQIKSGRSGSFPTGKFGQTWQKIPKGEMPILASKQHKNKKV